MATYPGRDSGTQQTESAGGEILREVLLYLGDHGSHLKVRAVHPALVLVLCVPRIDLPGSHLLLPPRFFLGSALLPTWGPSGIIGGCH